MNLFKYSLLLLFFAYACGTHEHAEDDKVLKEAAKIHLDAIAIEKTVKPKLDELIQRKNQLAVQGRELTLEEQNFIAKIDNLQASYNFWEENHVEVPGAEHDHDHHHDHGHDHHHHDHSPQLEVLPADMLIIQKEFRDSILSIQQRIKQLEQ